MSEHVGAFRILVVDDDIEIEEVVKQHLVEYGPKVIVRAATSADEASECLRKEYFDLALIDLISDKTGDQFGVEVYRRTDAQGISTRVMFMTKYILREDTARLLELMSSRSAWRIAGFLDKTSGFGKAIRVDVGREVDRFLAHRATVIGLEPVAEQIVKQRHRYKGREGHPITLRKSAAEVAAEIDRLLRELFVHLPGSAARTSKVSIELSPVERHGLSAAVVVNATVSVTLDGIDTGRPGHQTVLKIGPKGDILEETARFMEYVRYGVELAQRVELLGVATADALGGLVYSFAGGLYNNDLVSLDEVLVDDLTSANTALSTEVLSSLFSTRSWYSVTSDPVDVAEYFDKNYRADLQRSRSAGEQYLLDLDGKWDGGLVVAKLNRPRDHVRITVRSSGGKAIDVPDGSVLGWGPLLYRANSCLVHGDMHGGNVLLETSAIGHSEADTPRRHHRTCLIDFRNAGPGPRCIDAVCLESSIRLADAKSLQQTPLVKDGLLGRSNHAPIVDEVLSRFEDEKRVYKAVFCGQGEVPSSGWAGLCATVLMGLRSCFGDVSLQEYLATSIPYTVRALGFPLNDLSRLRIVTWLGAQFDLARELASGKLRVPTRRP